MGANNQVATKVDFKFKVPSNVNLVIWNDNTSVYEVVVLVLINIGIEQERALEIVKEAHNNGSAIVGTYPLEKARELKEKAHYYAVSLNSPHLKLTIEVIE